MSENFWIVTVVGQNPESEQALLELLPAEEDLTYATKLADGLCQLGSAKGFSRVQAMVQEGYDEGYLSLTESLYAYCVISGTEHPLLPSVHGIGRTDTP